MTKKHKETEVKQKDLLAEKDLQIAELTDTAKRLQAEFENYRKRSEKECSDYRCFAEAEFIKDMLPILDSFDIALNHNPDLKQIYAQLLTTLEKRGLKRIDRIEIFNPHLHEVMLVTTDKNRKDGEILEILQKGYVFKDKVIRTVKVKVNKLA